MLAELQRELIVANTNDGLASARARGRVGGRRPKLTPDQAELAQQLYDAREKTVQQIADMFNVPRPTVYGHLDRDKTVPRQPKKTAAANWASSARWHRYRAAARTSASWGTRRRTASRSRPGSSTPTTAAC
ncbi:helix-turn-helix domain-containing protein [Streptomyces atratus]|uniref:helix-turn-helix domain-containing protein n=1 Tax=Streptomyces atratus TaxID=1893 RepID=UPI003652FD64